MKQISVVWTLLAACIFFVPACVRSGTQEGGKAEPRQEKATLSKLLPSAGELPDNLAVSEDAQPKAYVVSKTKDKELEFFCHMLGKEKPADIRSLLQEVAAATLDEKASVHDLGIMAFLFKKEKDAKAAHAQLEKGQRDDVRKGVVDASQFELLLRERVLVWFWRDPQISDAQFKWLKQYVITALNDDGRK